MLYRKRISLSLRIRFRGGIDHVPKHYQPACPSFNIGCGAKRHEGEGYIVPAVEDLDIFTAVAKSFSLVGIPRSQTRTNTK